MTEYVPAFVKEDQAHWYHFFRAFKYKPGSVFEVYRLESVIQVGIQVWVPDSRWVKPKETGLYSKDVRTQRLPSGDTVMLFNGMPPLVQIGKSFVLPPWHDEDYALEFVRRCIQEIELHEVDEWIRLNGELKFDP